MAQKDEPHLVEPVGFVVERQMGDRARLRTGFS